MRQETIKLYKFEELKPEVQEKVIEKYNDINVNDGWWEFMFDNFKEELGAIGVRCETFYFDFYREKYLCMENAEVFNDNLFLKKAGFNKQLLLNSLEEEPIGFKISIGKNKEDNYIEIDYDITIYEDGKKLFDSDELTEYLREILRGFWKKLDKENDYLMSKDAIKETIEVNEFEFFENGERY